MKCSLFPFFFFLAIRWGGGGGGVISGRVRALNLTVPLGSGRVGSDNLGYGPGSGFSFEPVQTSTPHVSEKKLDEILSTIHCQYKGSTTDKIQLMVIFTAHHA